MAGIKQLIEKIEDFPGDFATELLQFINRFEQNQNPLQKVPLQRTRPSIPK